ncbi:RCC1 domain-containing protein [Botrytis cinerea]
MSMVYAIGSNGSGQLGIGHKEDVSVPKPVLFEDDVPGGVQQIRAGGNHTLMLSTSGKLYCSGDSSNGACGLTPDSHSSHSTFRRVKLSDDSTINEAPVVLCAATWEASIIVQQDEDGHATKIYSFGTGNKGELGLGEFLFRSSNPQLIKDFPPTGLQVVDLATSVSHVVAVLSNGDVYGWGSGRKGQIGEPVGIMYAPRKIEGLNFNVVRAVCGREFTYLLAESSSGQHKILGSDKWNIRSSAPDKIVGWTDVGSTWGSILLLQANKALLCWGKNDHGQLAHHSYRPCFRLRLAVSMVWHSRQKAKYVHGDGASTGTADQKRKMEM